VPFEGAYTSIPQGALDKSLKANDTVRMLMHHNADLEFGDSKRNLILHSDAYGLAFRCHLRNAEISSHVRALAESKAYSECSIGVEILKSETLRIRDSIKLPTGELTGYIGITEAKLPKEFHLSNVVTFPKKTA
jgi:HK97 family phage prohead protease